MHVLLKLLTQTAVRHHDVCVAATLLSAFLAPALDADGLVCLHDICDLQLWVHLEKSPRLLSSMTTCSPSVLTRLF